MASSPDSTPLPGSSEVPLYRFPRRSSHFAPHRSSTYRGNDSPRVTRQRTGLSLLRDVSGFIERVPYFERKQRAAAIDVRRDQRRELSRDADADGERERHRHAERRGPGALRPRKGKTLRTPTDPTDRERQDRQDEGRNDASGLQAGARGRPRHRRRRGRADPSGRRRRYDDAFADAGRRARATSTRLGWRRARRNPASWSPTRAIIRANN